MIKFFLIAVLMIGLQANSNVCREYFHRVIVESPRTWISTDKSVAVSIYANKFDSGEITILAPFRSDFKGGALAQSRSFKFDRITADTDKSSLLPVLYFHGFGHAVAIHMLGKSISKVLIMRGAIGKTQVEELSNDLALRKNLRMNLTPLTGRVAKSVFDFLVREAGAPSLEYVHEYRGMRAIENEVDGSFSIDLSGVKNFTQLLDLVNGLKELGMPANHALLKQLQEN